MARISLLTVLLLSNGLVLGRGGIPSAKFMHREVASGSPNAGVIPGLLGRNIQARQACTTSGYSLCPSAIVCCPTGGDCCPDNSCCPAGYLCFNLNGVEGCCPVGETCTSIGGCVTPGYVPCVNDSFCCPPGETCSRVNNIPMCNAAAPPPITTTTPAAPPPIMTTTPAAPPPVTTATTTRVVITTTPTPTIITPPVVTSASVPNTIFPPTTSVSSPSPGPTNATISPSSSSITYSGNWQSSSAVCNPGGQSKTCHGAGNSLSFKFTGTALYLLIAESPNGGQYSTTIDGQTTTSDSYSTSGATDCKVGFSQQGLADKEHTVVVKSLGVSSLAPSTSSGNVDFEGLILTQDTSSSPSTQNSMALPSFVASIYALTFITGFVLCLVI